ncbi:MAG: hypothetical protein L0Z53_20395 [Acidobacteriales bacterium]|nr:hypothetical protein [Terriglobales bacterium]
MDTQTLREHATDAIRYWEPKRILYNLSLAAIVILYFSLNLPRSSAFLTLNGLLFLFVLAVLANMAYCTAYVVDIFVQGSGFRQLWLAYRWVLFTVGLAFAMVIARYFCLMIFEIRR